MQDSRQSNESEPPFGVTSGNAAVVCMTGQIRVMWVRAASRGCLLVPDSLRFGGACGSSLPWKKACQQNTGVPHADLSAARWQELSDEAAANVARAIARENQAELVEVRDHPYAGLSRRIAVFERDAMRFSLVPAGGAVLGYDGGRFVPSPEQAASYARSADEYGLPPVAELVDSVTSPERPADLPAMLVGTEALEPSLADVAADDPRVLAACGHARPGSPGVTVYGREGTVKVEFDEAGQVRRARVAEGVSFRAALGAAASLGVRPATPDEWEYACGAGACTLFRWGDDSPGDCYPDKRTPGPQLEPNAWGLTIGQDPYRHEWTAEPGVVCGGDGEAWCAAGAGSSWAG